MLHLAAPARRLAPEALTFAVRLLHCAAPGAPAPPAGGAVEPDPAGPPSDRKWLLPEGGWQRAGQGAGAAVAPLDVRVTLGGAPGGAENAYFGSDAFRASALAAALGLSRRAAEVFGGAPALPELLAPAAAALRALGGAGLPQARARARGLVGGAAAASEAAVLHLPLAADGAPKSSVTVVGLPRAPCLHAGKQQCSHWKSHAPGASHAGWVSDQGQVIMVAEWASARCQLIMAPNPKPNPAEDG